LQQFNGQREVLQAEQGKIRVTDKNRLKFTKFIKKYAVGFPYTKPHEEADFDAENRLYVTQENLEEVLKLIYSARSKYLHEGDPMYLSEPIVNELAKKDINWDFDGLVGGNIDNRSFGFTNTENLSNAITNKKFLLAKLPYECLFERLVRYYLLKWFQAQVNHIRA